MAEQSRTLSENRKPPIETLIGLGFGTAWMLVGAFSLSSTIRSIAIGAVAVVALTLGVSAWFARSATTTGTANRKIFAWTIAGEMAGIFGGIVLGNVFARPDLILPAIGLAVGVHFFPLAFAFRNRIFIATSLGISTVSVACLAFHGQSRWLLLGFGAGACLWSTVLVDLIRKRRSHFASLTPSA
jgi:hypothetical protein